MPNNYSNVLLVGESLKEIVGKALCSHTNYILVHTVSSYTHNSAQTTSTEFQVLIESIDKVSLVFIGEHLLNSLACFLVEGG